MTPRTLLAAGMFVVLASMPAIARDLVVVSRSKLLQQALGDSYFAPFTAATGNKLVTEIWSGGLDTLRKQIETGATRWDLVMVNGDELQAGCGGGLFDKVNWAAVGGRDAYLPLAVSDCGVGAAVSALVLAWDRDKFPGTPNWADFWDVARYPGKRGLRKTARTNLEIALLADGVAPGDVYAALQTDDGVDRAFHRLDQIKPYVVWYEPKAQAPQILGSGEVLMTSADSPAIISANRTEKRHLGLQWAGSLISVLSWAVIKGCPEADKAAKLLSFASDPARQASFSAASGYGPVVKGVNEKLPADAQAASPTTPANLSAGLVVDEQFWHDHGDALNQRFETWLAH